MRQMSWAAGALIGFVMLAGCGDDDKGTPPQQADTGSDVVTEEDAETPVEFLNLRAEEVAPKRAVIRFDTNVPTTCEVELGTSPDALDQRATNPEMDGQRSVTHEIPLEDLIPETLYYAAARAETQSGAVALSDPISFETPPHGGNFELVNVGAVASGARVIEVSSNYGGGDNASTWGGTHAIDGLMSTEWATDGDGDAAYIEIELAQPEELTFVGFRSRSMTDGSAIIHKFQLTFDGTRTDGPFEAPSPSQEYVFPLTTPVTATRVRLDAVETTGGNTGVKEILLLRTAL